MSNPDHFIESVDLMERKLLQRIPLEILLLSFILAIPALFFFNIAAALFVLAGGFYSAINFIWLREAIFKFLQKEKKKSYKSVIITYALRLLLIIPIFFIIIYFFSGKILAFMVGFSTIIIVFLAESMVALSQLKKWKN